MKNYGILRLLSAMFIMVGLSQSTSHAQTTSKVELVQSFPIETTLQAPGIALTQQVWLDIINSATKTLDIEQYYISNSAGQSLDPVIAAIKAAAAKGVQVRILLDSAFYKNNPNEAADVINTANIQVKKIDFSPGIMHAKYLVADGVNAYTGSANMDWLALTHIQELGLHTVDASIGASLESIFNKDWPSSVPLVVAKPSAAVATGLPGFQIVASPKQANPAGIADSLDSITALIASAKTSIKIQLYQYSTAPYSGNGPAFTPIDDAIRAAAAKNVQVELMVDATVMNAKSKTSLQALATVPNVKIKAVTIPQWSGGPLKYARLIHSKFLVVDGSSAWIGSENWIDSYFLSTRNVGITIQDAPTSGQIGQIFDQTWTSSYAVAF